MAHIITKENLQDFEVRYSMASVCGKDERKSLDVVVKNDTLRYEVFNQGHRAGITTTLVDAIDIYNGI